MKNFNEFITDLNLSEMNDNTEHTNEISEQPITQADDIPKNYMFFGNLKKIKSNIDRILELDEKELDALLDEHDWAIDHISSANENIEQVAEFLLNR
jgi:hypothetical protein